MVFSDDEPRVEPSCGDAKVMLSEAKVMLSEAKVMLIDRHLVDASFQRDREDVSSPVPQIWTQLNAIPADQEDLFESTPGADARPPTACAAASPTVSERPPLAPGGGRSHMPLSSRPPLSPVAVPQATAQTYDQRPEATKKSQAHSEHRGGYPCIPVLPLTLAAAVEELSTRPPSSVGGRSPRQPASSPRAAATSGCTSPPSASTPRRRMNDLFHGSRSIIRYPECHQQNRSPTTTTRGGKTFTASMTSPRNLANDNFPRVGLRASNDCLDWLKKCQNHNSVENLVEEMMIDEQVHGLPGGSEQMADYRFAREHLRNASYRDATKCATSMARKAKPATKWR